MAKSNKMILIRDYLRCHCFSSSKTLTAIAMAILVDQKYISYKDSIIKHWPNFASTHGDFEKAKLRVKDVMRHESGLVRMDKCYDLENFMPDKIKVRSWQRQQMRKILIL